MSSTYVHDAAIEYGRDGNAGWSALEAALGALDGGTLRIQSIANTGLNSASTLFDMIVVLCT